MAAQDPRLSPPNETQDERRRTRARVARGGSVEIISKVERTAVRRSLHRLVRWFTASYFAVPSKLVVAVALTSSRPAIDARPRRTTRPLIRKTGRRRRT